MPTTTRSAAPAVTPARPRSSPLRPPITPTATTCEQFAGGTADNLTDLFYGKKGNKINNISPGVFFYYSKITAPASPFTIQVTQSNTLGWKPIGTMQLILWDANCVKTSVRGTFNPNTGTVTFNATGLTTGATYYIKGQVRPGHPGRATVRQPDERVHVPDLDQWKRGRLESGQREREAEVLGGLSGVH